MNFINGSFLWFALAGLVPIIIHLLNKQRYQRVRWAAMEFLLAAVRKTRKRVQLENLILLLLRIMLVLGLVMALARPFLTTALLSASDTHVIIVLDNSYSMGYRNGSHTLFDNAKDAALRIIDELRPDRGDKISLLTISDRPEIVIPEASINLSQAKKKLAELALTDYGTDIAKSVPMIQEIIGKSTTAQRLIYIITDNQQSAWSNLNNAQGAELLKQISRTAQIRVIEVGEPQPPNLAVTRLQPVMLSSPARSGIITVNMPMSFQAEIANHSSTPARNIKANFIANGLKQSTATVNIEPYKTAQVTFNYAFSTPGPNWVRVELEPDDLVIDDACIYACDVREFIRVLLVNGEPAAEQFEDEIGFLRYVYYPSKLPADDIPLQRDTAGRRITPYLVDTLSGAVFITTEKVLFNKYDLVVIANLDFIPQDKVKVLEQWANAGGGILIFLGDKVDRTNYNDLLYKNGAGLLPAQLGEIKGDKSHQQAFKMDRIDFNHPALAFFNNIPDRLRSMLIYEYYTTTVSDTASASASVSVLSRLNDTDTSPLMIEKSYGQGRVVLVTTSADTEWNMMAARQGYVVLIDQISMNLVRAQDQMIIRNILVGDTINFPARSYPANFLLTTPRRGMMLLNAASPQAVPLIGAQSANIQQQSPGDNVLIGQIIYPDTINAGLYTLEQVAADRVSKDKVSYFAVNPQPSEGDLRHISTAQLRAILGDSVRISGTADPGATVLNQSFAPPLSHLWKYLLYAVLGLALMEMFLAYRFGRSK